jgi:hypothetical protein
MGATSIKFKGVDAMRRKLQTFKMKFPEKVATALKVEAEIEATEVRKRTPVYVGPPGPGKPIPGLLRASIRVVGPVYERNRMWVEITAGGAAGAYAIPQHERLDYFHKVGQAKYLESVILESRPFMLQRVMARINLNTIL